MRTVALSILLSIAITSGAQAQSETQDQSNETVAALMHEFETLFSKGDVEEMGAWVDKHMLDSFTCVDVDGSLVMSKAEERAHLIEWVRMGARVETTEQKIRTVADTAIVTALTHLDSKSAKGTQNTPFRHMDVWIRQNGDWKWAACAGAEVANTTNAPSGPLKK